MEEFMLTSQVQSVNELWYDNINKGIVTDPSHSCMSQSVPELSSKVPAGMMKGASRNLRTEAVFTANNSFFQLSEGAGLGIEICSCQPGDSTRARRLRKSCKEVISDLVGGI